MVADFESFLKPVDREQQQSGDGKVINVHEPSGFCVHRVSSFPDYQIAPYTYSGPDIIDAFYDHVLREARIISDILSRNVPMKALSDEQQSSFDAAVTCRNCGNKFAYKNPKTLHHCHVTGNYLLPVCNNCNLALKPRKSSTRYTEGENNYLVPIVLHNMSAYDGHLLLHGFRRKYVEYQLQYGKVRYADIKVIPLNSENNLQIQIGNVFFLDSFQFLSASLETLVGTLRKSGTDNFVYTSKYLGTEDFLFQKGVFPYEYFTDCSKYQETALPPNDAFFNRLTNESLTDVDYEQASGTITM